MHILANRDGQGDACEDDVDNDDHNEYSSKTTKVLGRDNSKGNVGNDSRCCKDEVKDIKMRSTILSFRGSVFYC